MASKDYKAFIVEGEAREPQIIDNLQKIHFKNSNFKIITIPTGQNIYMLWKKMQEDDFETDIIEVLREGSKDIGQALEGLNRTDFSEVYLFFDYDGHQNNLSGEEIASSEVIKQMLESFNNETENGKLYISYPMVEALRDFSPWYCSIRGGCFHNIESLVDYKQVSAQRASYPEFKKYTYNEWKEAINVFVMRVSCLFHEEKMLSFEAYHAMVTPEKIFRAQEEYISKKHIFVLSAFTEFLLDYFQIHFWNSCIKSKERRFENCEKAIDY